MFFGSRLVLLLFSFSVFKDPKKKNEPDWTTCVIFACKREWKIKASNSRSFVQMLSSEQALNLLQPLSKHVSFLFSWNLSQWLFYKLTTPIIQIEYTYLFALNRQIYSRTQFYGRGTNTTSALGSSCINYHYALISWSWKGKCFVLV